MRLIDAVGEKLLPKKMPYDYDEDDNDLGAFVCEIKDIIDEQPTVVGWIPCSERLSEEHDTMFAKIKGTDKWNKAMFEKKSGDVNVTVEFGDGTRKTMTSHTRDGIWRCEKEYKIVKLKVIAWMPLPEPYL